MDENRRVDPRFIFSQPVEYSFPEISVNGSIAGNISYSGMSLKVQGFVPVGTILQLQLRLGQSPQVIWAKAKVVRVREVLADECYEIGLKFVRDEDCTKAIGKYIMGCRSKSM